MVAMDWPNGLRYGIIPRDLAPLELGMASAHFINDPEHWRNRAEETRILAEEMRDEISKQMMQRIAEDYERLAKRAELRLLGSKV